ncbi:hypothetical protein HYFRA_00007749 [Hymenoscyphus fraxineus]|uniref:RBR-type E3 ubiquitin transferase n=1 Tax=Hymenoscyphus fraxineus TaxID=746836 RepID=A0A9N9KP29_9HELO|nr:hypothetical protein HYFRA_00007749 [Hymenoscyphus fraxineus]
MSSRDHPRQLSALDGSAPPFHPAYDKAAYDNLQQQTIHNQALSDGHFQYGLLHRNLPEPFLSPYHPRQLPQPFLTNPPGMTSAEPSPTCVICLGEKEASEFPYKCPKNCPEQQTCNSCLKDWFIEACRNESRMPPKCCSAEPIPFSTVLHLLSSEQIKLYKSKYEEWSTPNRIYCPVPTCSAFIPPKLYAIPEKPLYVLDPQFNPSQPPQPGLAPTQRPNVQCPACYTSICTTCRSFSHRGECKESDIDPLLEKKLKKWKIKRCPKCRAGVRKVFGCSHVQCRCGAHFCFQCLKALNQCFGCEDDDQTEDEEVSRPAQRVLVDEDDLDGRTQFFEGDGHNFGTEPHGGMFLDPWACQHRWAQWGHVLAKPQHTGSLQGPECQTCFLPTTYLPELLSQIEPGNLKHRMTAWECIRCHILKCGACIVSHYESGRDNSGVTRR